MSAYKNNNIIADPITARKQHLASASVGGRRHFTDRQIAIANGIDRPQVIETSAEATHYNRIVRRSRPSSAHRIIIQQESQTREDVDVEDRFDNQALRHMKVRRSGQNRRRPLFPRAPQLVERTGIERGTSSFFGNAPEFV